MEKISQQKIDEKKDDIKILRKAKDIDLIKGDAILSDLTKKIKSEVLNNYYFAENFRVTRYLNKRGKSGIALHYKEKEKQGW